MDHLFSTLGRYTRFVFFGKLSLGLIAFALLATLVALPLLSKDRSGMRISFVDSSISQAQKADSPVMSSPEYHGTNLKGDQYKLNGTTATQMTPTMIRIDKLESQLVTAKGAWREVTADTGDYNQETKVMELTGNVTLMDDENYTFVSSQATVETKPAMHIIGHEPVNGVGPLGNLLASSFEIMDSGKHLIFLSGPKQRVWLHIDRSQEAKNAQKTQKTKKKG